MSVQGAHIYLEIDLKTYSCTDLPKYQGVILKKHGGARIIGVTRFSYFNKNVGF